MSISLFVSNLLLKANLDLHWKFDGEMLLTAGNLSFKLPLREKMQFVLSGKDSSQALEFRYEDGKKYFGSWLRAGDKILFEDQRKKTEYVFREPVMSVGAMLFTALQSNYDRARSLYVGGERTYPIEFLRDQNSIRIFLADENKNVGNLFLEDGKLSGGEIILPVLGKIHFRA